MSSGSRTLVRCHLRNLPYSVTAEQLNGWLQQDDKFFGITQKIVRKGEFHASFNNKASAFAFCRKSDVCPELVEHAMMVKKLGPHNCHLSLAVGLGTASGAFQYASPDEPGLPHYEALEEWMMRHGLPGSPRDSQPVEAEEPKTPEGAPSEGSPVEGSPQPVTPAGAFEGSPQPVTPPGALQPVPEEGPVLDYLVPRGSVANFYKRQRTSAPGLNES